MDVNDHDELVAAMTAAVKADNERNLNAFLGAVHDLRRVLLDSAIGLVFTDAETITLKEIENDN